MSLEIAKFCAPRRSSESRSETLILIWYSQSVIVVFLYRSPFYLEIILVELNLVSNIIFQPMCLTTGNL